MCKSLLLWLREEESCMTCMMAKAKPGSQRRKRPSSQCCRDILCCFLCLYLLQKLIIILNNCLRCLPPFSLLLPSQIGSDSSDSFKERNAAARQYLCVNNCPLLRKIWAASKRVGLIMRCYRVSQYTFLATGRLHSRQQPNLCYVLQGGPGRSERPPLAGW